MLYIRSSEVILLINESLYPLTYIFPFSPHHSPDKDHSESIMVGEISQTEKGKCCMVSFTCETNKQATEHKIIL